MNERWKAYISVDKWQVSPLRRDFMRNKVLDFSDKRIKGMGERRILQTAYALLKRSIHHRTKALDGKTDILHCDLIGG